MFVLVVGFVLALIFFGLPLGIIGLFILSILDQKSRGAESAARRSTLESQGADRHKTAYIRETAQTRHKKRKWPVAS